MPAEKVQIIIEENLSDEDEFETYFYADVDQNGDFVFPNLDLKRFGNRKCDFHIGIVYGYDKERNYKVTSKRWYRIK